MLSNSYLLGLGELSELDDARECHLHVDDGGFERDGVSATDPPHRADGSWSMVKDRVRSHRVLVRLDSSTICC